MKMSGDWEADLLSPETKRKRVKDEDSKQHIGLERNRRKQMNHHFTVLRSLMPAFYVKRGDQASLIGGVADYIIELQQILESLVAKKQRKVYSEVVQPLISPTTPQPCRPRQPPPAATTSSSEYELLAHSKTATGEVEVKLAGDNLLLLKTWWRRRIPGQATKLIALLESLSLEVLETKISIVDEAMVNSFTIKIGVECQLSAEELAQHIQHSFS